MSLWAGNRVEWVAETTDEDFVSVWHSGEVARKFPPEPASSCPEANAHSGAGGAASHFPANRSRYPVNRAG